MAHTKGQRTQKALEKRSERPLPKWVVLALVGYFLLGWSWLLTSDSLRLAGSKSIGLVVGVLALALHVTISIGTITYSFRFARRFITSHNRLVHVGQLWLLFAAADAFIAWACAIIWIGTEGKIDSSLPLASPALWIVHTPWRFAARIIGFYGLAGALWALLFLSLNGRKSVKELALLASVLSIVTSLGWLLWPTQPTPPIKSTIVTERSERPLQHIATNGSAITVLPEYGMVDPLHATLPQRITDLTNNAVVGSTKTAVASNGIRNDLVVTRGTKTISKQLKYRPIPAGEDLPYSLLMLLRLTGQNDVVNYFESERKIATSSQPLKPVQLNNATVLGAAVCSSIVQPEDYRHLTNQGATLLSNSASLSVFKKSPVFAWQHTSLAQFMAVANNRYLLQGASGADAFAINNSGTVIARQHEPGALHTTAYNQSSKTLYTSNGEWVAKLGGLFYLVTASIHLLLPTVRRILQHNQQ